MENNRILLVNFYNPKSLGMRYLEKALSDGGFEVTILYFKGFHSNNPQKPSKAETDYLLSLIDERAPLFIGFSVMTSLYLEVVEDVSAIVSGHTEIPLVWGGIYATLFPERSLKHCDYVIRGEGEDAAVELASRISGGADLDDMQNLAFMKDGAAVVNPVRPLVTELDTLGMADVGLPNKYFIESGAIVSVDPMQSSYSYETACTRGCPFMCSYCSNVGIRRIYRDNRHFLRFRSVDSIISELKDIKSRNRRLSVVHFWDEIFPDDQGWTDEFTARYKAEIGLPFEIWAHPLKINGPLIKKLRGAGLYQIVMGIQSGSPEVRKTAFHRMETQEQVLAAAKVMADNRIPRVIYDFILRHPFETHEQIRETYELCTKLPGKFTLQLHDLNFVPGTDIAAEAVKRGIYTEAEMESIMYAPMETLYAKWWGSGPADPVTDFWYRLIYMTQFRVMRGAAARLAKDPDSEKARKAAARWHGLGKRLSVLQRYWQKGSAVLSGGFRRLRG